MLKPSAKSDEKLMKKRIIFIFILFALLFQIVNVAVVYADNDDSLPGPDKGIEHLLLEKQIFEDKATFLAQENSTLAEKITGLEKTKADLEANLGSSIKENKGLVEKIIALEKTKADLEANLGFSLKENKGLAEKVPELEEAKTELEKEIASLHKIAKDVELESARQKELYTQLEEKTKEVHLKEDRLKRREREFINLNKLVDALNDEQIMLKRENERFRQELAALEESTRKEKTGLYEKLGMAYMQLQLFDLAIESYEQALSINSLQAGLHYHLGLLYKHARNNAQKSIYHLREYLKLAPETRNREEVEYLIEAMKR
jgi:chromosome segregation ATPase